LTQGSRRRTSGFVAVGSDAGILARQSEALVKLYKRPAPADAS